MILFIILQASTALSPFLIIILTNNKDDDDVNCVNLIPLTRYSHIKNDGKPCATTTAAITRRICVMQGISWHRRADGSHEN